MEAPARNQSELLQVPLQLMRVRLAIELLAHYRIPRLPGSALRGLLGHGLKKLYCITGNDTCPGCALYERCRYISLFDSPGGLSGDRFIARPHAWVIDIDAHPPRDYLRPGDTMQFGMCLVADAVHDLPGILRAWQHAGRLGLGKQGVPFRLSGVWVEQQPGSNAWERIDIHKSAAWQHDTVETIPLPPLPERIRMQLQTPLRIKRQGRLVRPEALALPVLLGALRMRMRDLLNFYGPGDADAVLPDLRKVKEQYRFTESRLEWLDEKRYSNRQKAGMRMGGIVGEIEFGLEGIEDWWQWLVAGQWLHIGKLTSMGLGQYRVTSL